ncbi:MAG: hypothetical protein H6599_05845 [Flavobacteriales bacterium]|nr:hypothetical protein [Flavobacteriales bacterium]
MPKLLLILLLFFCFDIEFSQSEAAIIHQGRYRQKNLYVQNPFAGSGVGFCVTQVFVNDSIYNGDINSSAFEVDFKRYGFKEGDSISVKIIHKTDCLPKVLNPPLITPKCTFTTDSIWIEHDTLFWITRNEHFQMTFQIQQYRWNKWIFVGTEFGQGFVTIENKYFQKVELHSGTNKFRVIQYNYSGKPCKSPNILVESNSDPISYKMDHVNMNLTFSKTTKFEIFDADGNLVKLGETLEIDCNNLKRNTTYWLNYDNIIGEEIKFKKKNKQ